MRLGYAAVVMTDPVLALNAFATAPEKYDLIITDLTLPSMSRCTDYPHDRLLCQAH
jgi:CheY-like chemotaxis protein